MLKGESVKNGTGYLGMLNITTVILYFTEKGFDKHRFV